MKSEFDESMEDSIDTSNIENIENGASDIAGFNEVTDVSAIMNDGGDVSELFNETDQVTNDIQESSSDVSDDVFKIMNETKTETEDSNEESEEFNEGDSSQTALEKFKDKLNDLGIPDGSPEIQAIIEGELHNVSKTIGEFIESSPVGAILDKAVNVADNVVDIYHSVKDTYDEATDIGGIVTDMFDRNSDTSDDSPEKTEESVELIEESVELNGEIAEVAPLENLNNWIDDINPNFDEFDIDSPYSNNCGSCAFAVYQRLEGDPDICATAENIGYNSEMEALTGMEQVSMTPQEIEARLLEAGDGAHAIIGIDRAEGAGHWFNAACIDGKVVTIDGQDGSINDWPPDYGDVVNWEMSIRKENDNG